MKNKIISYLKRTFLIPYEDGIRYVTMSRMFLVSRLKLFWYRLWIRKNEFHKSLDMDIEALMTMTEKQKDAYMNDLMRRREIAHRKGIGKNYDHLVKSFFKKKKVFH